MKFRTAFDTKENTLHFSKVSFLSLLNLNEFVHRIQFSALSKDRLMFSNYHLYFLKLKPLNQDLQMEKSSKHVMIRYVREEE